MTSREDRIAELLVPFLEGSALSTAQLERLSAYLDLLVKWNSKINLTAVRNSDEIVTRHFGESLFAARQLFPEPIAESVIDVGSGAGFPGIPMKIWNESAVLLLIESSQKKAVFLREVVRMLGLDRVSIETARAEKAAVRAELVTLRAVERFDQILKTAHGLLKTSGRLALLIGESQLKAANSALPDLDWQSPVPIPLSQNRTLLVGTR
jgi:16S rRNA (guanine527-N7)-methyltransferase